MADRLRWILDLANNHNGSVERAKRIIDAHSGFVPEFGLDAYIKFQFRQLDTFVHKDFQNSDLKYVKRFRSTRLSLDDFKDIAAHARNRGFKVAATPFDEASLPWLDEIGVDLIKVASCSVDDGPLLKAIASNTTQPIVISTAGASDDDVRNARTIVESVVPSNAMRTLTLMHCVADYPTGLAASNLNRINELKQFSRPLEFSYFFDDIDVGISTHESPDNPVSIVPLAVAMGCRTIEKHIDIIDDLGKPNAYSCTPLQLRQVIVAANQALIALEGKSETQGKALDALKRGLYVKNDLKVGHVLASDDLYFAFPCQGDKGQYPVARLEELIGLGITLNLSADAPLCRDAVNDESIRLKALFKRYHECWNIDIGLHFTPDDDVEFSAHYGLDEFPRKGACIINKINREFCKKLILMLPNQQHPAHRHDDKVEAFELLTGDCELVLGDEPQQLELGKVVVIEKGVMHSFSSKAGCMLEEISTTHNKGTSIYEDEAISQKPLSQRKFHARMSELWNEQDDRGWERT